MTPEALSAAFDRLEDFMAVQTDENGRIGLEPVLRLQESVGLGDAHRAMLAERLGEVQPQAAPGAVLFGLIVALSAADLVSDSPSP